MGMMQSSILSITTPPASMLYVAPADGGTVNITVDVDVCVLEPAGTLTGLTVNLPATASPGKVITVSCTAIITTLTLGAGASSVVGALTAFVANGFACYIYRSTKWYRCG